MSYFSASDFFRYGDNSDPLVTSQITMTSGPDSSMAGMGAMVATSDEDKKRFSNAIDALEGRLSSANNQSLREALYRDAQALYEQLQAVDDRWTDESWFGLGWHSWSNISLRVGMLRDQLLVGLGVASAAALDRPSDSAIFVQEVADTLNPKNIIAADKEYYGPIIKDALDKGKDALTSAGSNLILYGSIAAVLLVAVNAYFKGKGSK